MSAATRVEFIRIGIFLGVALRILVADQKQVAGFRADLATDVAVALMVAVFAVVIAFRRRAVHHFVTQGLGLDVAALPDARRHLVDLKGVGTGGVHYHRCVDLGAVGQANALDPAIGGANLDYFGVEKDRLAKRLIRFYRPYWLK